MSPRTLFLIMWVVFAALFAISFGWALPRACKKAGFNVKAGLIDNRERYSLNRFQLVMWTVIILSAFVALFFSRGLVVPKISAELLGLIGLASGSAVAAGAVKASKDVQSANAKVRKELAQDAIGPPSSQASVVALQGLVAKSPAVQMVALREAAEPQVPRVEPAQTARWVQMLLEEEGEAADKVVSVTKFQSLILTLVAAVAVIALIVQQETLALEFPQEFLWLFGIGQITYVGGKIPNMV